MAPALSSSTTPFSRETAPGSFRRPTATFTAILMAHGAAAAIPASLLPEVPPSDDATQLPKMFVEDARAKSPTSPKFTQPLRDVPQTIVVIPNSVYVEQGATSLRDVLRNTPGITFQAGEGGSATGDNLTIRGFGARNDVFIDGVRDPGVLTRDTFNIDQVEVAKGPSSATSGRGTTGGSVNEVTKLPRRGDFTSIQATAGSADYGRVTLDANQELPSSPVTGTAIRLNAVWTDGGVAGRDVIKNRNWGVAPSLALGLGQPTTLTLAYQHMSQDNIPDYGLPGTLPAGAIAAGKTLADLDFSNFYGLVARDYERVESDSATAIVEHKLNADAALRNLTRYSRNLRDAVVTPPRAAAIPPTAPLATNGMLDPGYNPAVPQIRRTDTKYQDRSDEIVANQTNLTARFATGPVKHALAAGLEVSRELQKVYTRADTYAHGRPPITDLYHPDPYQPYVGSIARTGAYTRAAGDSGALYAFDTLKLSRRWELNGGGRFEVFDVAFKSVPVTGAATQLSRTDDMFSWRAGLVFKPIPAGSVYAGYGTSFNPSADAAQGLSLATTGTSSASLAPEKNRSAELGTKWNFLHERFAVTAALFRTEKTNARTTDALGNTVLAGHQRVDGLELGATGKLTDAWLLFAGYAYMDGTVRSSGLVQQVDAALQYVPKQTFNLWTTYELPCKLTLGAGSQFMDGYFYALPTVAAPNPTPGLSTKYTLYSAMLSYPLTSHVTLRLNANNLADKRYIDRGYSGHVIPGAGRTLLFSVGVTF